MPASLTPQLNNTITLHGSIMLLIMVKHEPRLQTILDSLFSCVLCFQLHLATPSQEFNREEAEKQRRMMEGSPPTPRSLRLAQLSSSQEDMRR